MTSINIIAYDNGVGLTRDVQLLSSALRQLHCDVAVTSVDQLGRRRRKSRWVQWGVRTRRWWAKESTPPKFDINLMLEQVWPEHLNLAWRNVSVPNPEWFDKHDRRFLSAVDHVWAKTQTTQTIFEALGRPATLVGFDSEDRYLPDVPREPVFFHLAGKSPLKGTQRLLALWQKHPEWPTLTVVQSRAPKTAVQSISNVSYRAEYLSDDELRRLQNASAFHLCPSETEGWGHYIVEALSVGATTITIDAAPMNELVTPERGVLAAYASTGRKRLATTYLFDEAKLGEAIERVSAMSPVERAAMAEAGRAWFLDNKRGFPARLERGINAVLGR